MNKEYDHTVHGIRKTKSSLSISKDAHPYLQDKYILNNTEALFSPSRLAKIQKSWYCTMLSRMRRNRHSLIWLVGALNWHDLYGKQGNTISVKTTTNAHTFRPSNSNFSHLPSRRTLTVAKSHSYKNINCHTVGDSKRLETT